MSSVTVTREDFLKDRHGRTFADVVDDPQFPFVEVFAFFDDECRQRRMKESEIHHDRAPFAGVVREFEANSRINQFLAGESSQRTKRFRQAVGVLIRMIMQRHGWRKTGRKGSLGVRKRADDNQRPQHNTGGLALWFLRAERYEPKGGLPFASVRERCAELDTQPKNRNGSRLQEVDAN